MKLETYLTNLGGSFMNRDQAMWKDVKKFGIICEDEVMTVLLRAPFDSVVTFCKSRPRCYGEEEKVYPDYKEDYLDRNGIYTKRKTSFSGRLHSIIIRSPTIGPSWLDDEGSVNVFWDENEYLCERFLDYTSSISFEMDSSRDESASGLEHKHNASLCDFFVKEMLDLGKFAIDHHWGLCIPSIKPESVYYEP